MLQARKSLTTKLLESGLLRSKGLIAGEWLPAASGKLLAVLDPATGSEVERVPAMGAEDTERAVSAAAESFGAWKGRTMPVRYKGFTWVFCLRICELIVVRTAAVGALYPLQSVHL